MSVDQNSLKAFLHEAKERAADILSAPHIGEDVKKVILDLLQLGENFENLLQHSSGQSADTRILKKKMDQVKVEQKAVETKLESAKLLFLAMVSDVKGISIEVASILKRHAADANDPDVQSAGRIKLATQKIAEVIAQSSKL